MIMTSWGESHGNRMLQEKLKIFKIHQLNMNFAYKSKKYLEALPQSHEPGMFYLLSGTQILNNKNISLRTLNV